MRILGQAHEKAKYRLPGRSPVHQSSARVVDVDSVPVTEWDAIAKFGLEAVWLMILWVRPDRHRDLKSKPGFSGRFPRARPDFRPEDNVGSPTPCGARRRPHLGGTEGLAAARCGARQAWDAADYGFCAMGRAS